MLLLTKLLPIFVSQRLGFRLKFTIEVNQAIVEGIYFLLEGCMLFVISLFDPISIWIVLLLELFSNQPFMAQALFKVAKLS